jgi:Cysteine-rich secretory protein family
MASKPPRKNLLHHARHALLPLKGNNHHPQVLKREIVIGVLACALLLEVAVLGQGIFFLNNTNNLASIFPAVVADLTNTQRTDNGLPALTLSPLLTEAAQDKANDEAAKGYFSHVSPDGTLPWYWFKLVGYNYSFAGENLAVNFNDSSDVVNAWMASPTHRANILKQEYTETGIGMATGTYQGQATIFVVQFFAQPESPASSGAVAVATPPASQPSAPEAAKPAQVIPAPTELMTTSAPSSTTPTVLGIQTNTPSSPTLPKATPTFFQKLFASPFSTANLIFTIIAAFFIAVLIAGLVYRKRLPRMTATISGLAVVVVVLGFAIANQYFFSNGVQIDSTNASLSATAAN